METKILLVTGATGKQGKALISAIQTDTTKPSPFHILALTRNPRSPAAKQLSALETKNGNENVEVVEGDLDNADSVRRVFEDAKKKGGVWGVFCVLAFPGLGANADGEERQGKTLADLALEYGVACFVYSSVERGGEGYDDKLTLDRLAKVRIERHLRGLGDKGLNWTILRPGFFMENFEGTIGSITVGVLKAGLKPDTTVQLIAVDNIGFVAAAVFKAPERYTSKVLLVVGDICTSAQLQDAYKSAVGREIPSIPSFLARALIKMNGHTQGLIQDMERVHLTRIDPNNDETENQMAAAREAYPDMTSFASWAAQRHGKTTKREKGWNQVTLGRLFTGKQ
ncbi:hypothetical protein C0989_002175 [Termitomyces sp. Mn162]|nr:hypothetical protein C0989_002175 [Termitomyces sp. Mn162]